MIHTRDLVARFADTAATSHDRAEAFRAVVRRFEDMAYGYAYALLGNEADAQDATQQAFLTAWRKVDDLRDPAAFVGWFRRVVRTQCDTLARARRRRPTAVEAAPRASNGPDPHTDAEAGEVRSTVRRAIAALPEHERVTTTLYYIDGYSHGQIAGFLGVKATAVSTRLHSARGRLRGRLEPMAREVIQGARPSRDDTFVQELFTSIRQSDVDRLRGLIGNRHDWRDARDPRGRDPVAAAADTDVHLESGPQGVYSLLLEEGGRPGLGAAIKAGDTDTVRDLIARTPELLTGRFTVDFWDQHGANAPVAVAGRYGHTDLVNLLVEAGADPSADGDPALTTARDDATIDALLEHGAAIDPHPKAPCGPLAFACEIQHRTAVKHLLERGANANAPVWSEFRGGRPSPTNPDQGRENPALWLHKAERPVWPIFIALGTPFGAWDNLEGGYGFLPEILEALVGAGADVSAARPVLVEDELCELTPLDYAREMTKRASRNTGTVADDPAYLRAVELLRTESASG